MGYKTLPVTSGKSRRLTLRPGCTDELEEPSSTAFMVHEEDQDLFTGLYDASGEPIYKEKEPMGFVIKGTK